MGRIKEHLELCEVTQLRASTEKLSCRRCSCFWEQSEENQASLGKKSCSRTHQVYEFGDWNFSDGSLHPAQGLERGAKAAGQVGATDGQEIVLASVQVQDKDILNFILARVEEGDRVLADIHVQGDLCGLICNTAELSRTHRHSPKGVTRINTQGRDKGHNRKDKTDGKEDGTQERQEGLNGDRLGCYSSTLTWLQVTFTRFSPKPWLAVVAVIELWDEGEVTGDLPIIGNLKLLFLQLTELHILKLELQSKEKSRSISGQHMARGQPRTDSAVAPMAEEPTQCRIPHRSPAKEPRQHILTNPIPGHNIKARVQYPVIQFI